MCVLDVILLSIGLCIPSLSKHISFPSNSKIAVLRWKATFFLINVPSADLCDLLYRSTVGLAMISHSFVCASTLLSFCKAFSSFTVVL